MNITQSTGGGFDIWFKIIFGGVMLQITGFCFLHFNVIKSLVYHCSLTISRGIFCKDSLPVKSLASSKVLAIVWSRAASRHSSIVRTDKAGSRPISHNIATRRSIFWLFSVRRSIEAITMHISISEYKDSHRARNRLVAKKPNPYGSSPTHWIKRPSDYLLHKRGNQQDTIVIIYGALLIFLSFTC